jgi:hypothetical protein
MQTIMVGRDDMKELKSIPLGKRKQELWLADKLVEGSNVKVVNNGGGGGGGGPPRTKKHKHNKKNQC